MLRKTLVLLLLISFLTLPVAAYTIYLKDGSRIMARDEYVIEGDKAIITLENGTQTFIAASEIDRERTVDANKSNLGGALIFEDGRFVERTVVEDAPPKRETVSDLIARGGANVRTPTRTESSTPTELPIPSVQTSIESVQREPMREIEIATAIKQAFADRGLENAAIFQGTEQYRPLIELNAESEATVFRNLELATEVLLEVHETYPACDVMELLISTSGHERAGEFELTVELAQELQSDHVEVAAFFIDHVRF